MGALHLEIACSKHVHSFIKYQVPIKYKPLDYQIEHDIFLVFTYAYLLKVWEF